MFKNPLHPLVRLAIKIVGGLAFTSLLLVAACAENGADASDNAKNHGFYGSVIGGGVPP